MLDYINRDELVSHLKEKGINVAIFYPNVLHRQECFKYLGYEDNAFGVADAVSTHIINLPCYGELLEEEQSYIINTFIELISQYNIAI